MCLLWIGVCVFVRVCIYVCLFPVSVYLWLWVCVFIFIRFCRSCFMNVSSDFHISLCVYLIWVGMYVCVCVCVCVCVFRLSNSWLFWVLYIFCVMMFLNEVVSVLFICFCRLGFRLIFSLFLSLKYFNLLIFKQLYYF